MNIDILKKNIEQVIHQPCIASPWMKDCTTIRANGLSNDCKYIMVKTTPDDTSWHCNLTEDYVDRMLQNDKDSLV